jgi:hypothetical protein
VKDNEELKKVMLMLLKIGNYLNQVEARQVPLPFKSKLNR